VEVEHDVDKEDDINDAVESGMSDIPVTHTMMELLWS
jgi:hypothetical protein